MDMKGQIALEYLLIFFILIIILSVISIHLKQKSKEAAYHPVEQNTFVF